jgi:hypothetical protein
MVLPMWYQFSPQHYKPFFKLNFKLKITYFFIEAILLCLAT